MSDDRVRPYRTSTVGGTPYLFASLERIGGIMTFDATNPASLAIVDFAAHEVSGTVTIFEARTGGDT